MDSDFVKEPIGSFFKIVAGCYWLRVKCLCILFNLHRVDLFEEVLNVSGTWEPSLREQQAWSWAWGAAGPCACRNALDCSVLWVHSEGMRWKNISGSHRRGFQGVNDGQDGLGSYS